MPESLESEVLRLATWLQTNRPDAIFINHIHESYGAIDVAIRVMQAEIDAGPIQTALGLIDHGHPGEDCGCLSDAVEMPPV